MAGRARKIDDDQVRPAVVIDVVRPASETMAITIRAIAVAAWFLNLVHLPVRRLVPDFAGKNVRPSVPIDVGYGHAFGAECFVDHGFLPGNGRGPVVGPHASNGQEKDWENAQQKRKRPT